MTAYTLFGQASLGIGSNTSTARLTIGCEFEVSQSVVLTGIWWFAPPGAGGLPSQCGIYSITDGAFIAAATNTSPAWSGSGANAWNKVSYDGSVTLVSGKKYQVCVFADGSVTANWFSSVAGYWTTGPGASGITNGPLSAPSNASSAGGQDMVQSGGLALTAPNITESGKNYGVDVEVQIAASAIAVTEAASASDSLAVAAAVALTESGSAADALAVTASAALTESGAASDALAVTATVHMADSGSASDAGSVAGAVVLAEDGGTASEVLTVAAAVMLADHGSAAEFLSVGGSLPVPGTGSPAVSNTANATAAVTAAGTGSASVSPAASGAAAVT